MSHLSHACYLSHPSHNYILEGRSTDLVFLFSTPSSSAAFFFLWFVIFSLCLVLYFYAMYLFVVRHFCVCNDLCSPCQLYNWGFTEHCQRWQRKFLSVPVSSMSFSENGRLLRCVLLALVFICGRHKPAVTQLITLIPLTLWRRSPSTFYLGVQSVPQREHHTSPLQRSTG
jgi:hypothetical protein